MTISKEEFDRKLDELADLALELLEVRNELRAAHPAEAEADKEFWTQLENVALDLRNFPREPGTAS